jgi:PAS domain S-box-containing protein
VTNSVSEFRHSRPIIRPGVSEKRADGVVACDEVGPDLIVSYANDAFRELLDVPPSSTVVGERLMDLIEPWLSDAAKDEFRHGVVSGNQLLLRLRRSDSLENRLRLMLRPAAVSDAWIGSLAEITENGVVSIESAAIRQLGDAEREQGTRAGSTTFVADLPAVVLRFAASNDDLTLTHVAGAIEPLTGEDADAVLADPRRLLAGADSRAIETFERRLQHAARSGDGFKFDFPIVHARSRRHRWLRIITTTVRSIANDGDVVDGLLTDITDLKETESRLLDKNAGLSRVLAAIPAVVFRITLDANATNARCAFVSRSCETLFGLPESTLLAHGGLLDRVAIGEDRTRAELALRRAALTLSPLDHEFRVRRADGKVAWIRATAEPHVDSGEQVSFSGILTDVSGQRVAYERLSAVSRADRAQLRKTAADVKRYRQQLREIADDVPGALFRCSLAPDLEFTFFSRRIETLFGVAGVHFLGDPSKLLGFVQEEWRHPTRREWERCARELRPWNQDLPIDGPAGDTRWIRVAATPVRGDDGHVHYHGLISDVTEVAELRRRLSDGAIDPARGDVARQPIATTSRTDIICRVDANGAITFINEAGVRSTSKPAHSLLGTSWFDLFPVADRMRLSDELDALRPDCPLYRQELRIDRPDRRWYAWTVRASFSASGERRGFQVLGKDIQAIKELETRICEISKRERERIGHDLHDGLSQDLMAIMLMLKALERDTHAQAPQLTERLRSAGELAGRCVGAARAFAEGLSIDDVDTDGFAGGIRRLAASTQSIYGIPVDVTVAGERADVDPSVATDLYRIAQEALGNAARHAEAKRIDVRVVGNGERLSLEIEDDGIGLSPDRADADSGGLGLKIMRHRAAAIGAQFEIAAADSGGTLVRCILQRKLRESTGGT